MRFLCAYYSWTSNVLPTPLYNNDGEFMLFVSKVTATITKVLFLDMQLLTHIQVNPVITCSLACSKDNEPYWSR